MADRKQFNVWLSEKQFERWKDYEEELGFQSRGQMVRRAVEFFYTHRTSDSGAMDEQLFQDISEIKDKLNDFGSEVKQIRSEQLSQDNIAEFAQETAFFMDKSQSGQEVIDRLAEDGIEYVKIDLDKELRDVAHVPTEDPLIVDIEKARENDALRSIIAQIDDSDYIKPISKEEAAAYSL